MHAHDTDWFSLVSGAFFLLIGAGAIISAETGLWLDGRWIGPTLLALMAVGIVAGIRKRDVSRDSGALTADEQRAMAELPEPPQ
jgi:hypothetical protein